MPNRASQIKTEVENQYLGSFLKRRVENGLIFQRPDGKEEHRYTTGPWHWRQKDTDQWIEIDTDIENSGDAIWKHHIKSAKFDTFLTDDGRRRFYPRRWITGEYAEIGALEWEANDNWQTIPAGTLSRLNNRLVGEDKATHKLEIGITGMGARTNLIIKYPTVARPLRWKVNLVGLDWNEKERALVSQKDGKKVGFIRPPFWTDSSKNPEPHEIAWEYKDGYFTLTPDFTDAVFPVIIDPDYSIIAGADDGQQCNGVLTITGTTITIGIGMYVSNGWFRFPSIIASQGATCSAASLKVICTGSNNYLWSEIFGIDEDDHAAPTTNAQWVTDHGMHTSSSVPWDETENNWITGDEYESPDLSDILNEIFGREGWESGNDVGIHWDGDAYSNFQTRVIASYENTTYTEPILSLTFEEAPTQKEVLDAGSGADAVSIKVKISVAETGQGADTPGILGKTLIPETGSGADAVATTQIKIILETGIGSDAINILGKIALTDLGAGSDVISILTKLILAESGAGADEVTVEIGVLQKQVSDSGVGTDALSLLIKFALSDTGIGTEAISALVKLAISDSGIGSEIINVLFKILQTDTGVGTEALEILRKIAISDSGATTEALTILVQISLTESGTGVDQIFVAGAVKQVTDSGAGVDAISVLAGLVITDAGIGTEIINILSKIALSDTATGSDALQVLIKIAVSDTAVGTEAIQKAVALAIQDAGVGSEILTILAEIIVAESGSAMEALKVASAIAVSDSGAGTEAIECIRSLLLLDTGIGTDVITEILAQILIGDVGIGVDRICVPSYFVGKFSKQGDSYSPKYTKKSTTYQKQFPCGK